MDTGLDIDTFFVSVLSLTVLFLFTFIKYKDVWPQNKYWILYVVFWIVLELAALILLSLQTSGLVRPVWLSLESIRVSQCSMLSFT
jgi:hypothetical protein